MYVNTIFTKKYFTRRATLQRNIIYRALLARDFSLFTLFTPDIVSVRIKEFARKIPRHSIHELVLLKRVPFVPMPFAYKPIYFAMLSKTLYITKHCSLNSNWRESNFAKLFDRNRQRLIDFKKKKKRLLQ